ncbi:McrB family protein [Pseudoalteromonas luteoviolacea]|uniref:AAA+ ATPase domain-containing protein n=1 Tax=Pseudoalteromonas luteoviolacea DSM 6061 TaxID=1365250 RepID=A0A166XYC0_9GAMM|nr:AAA family ATPase [Pseudoalteromonas luteoviolacea]KZN41038.1 hypothetical protein N475_01260 [Pseudoalteromonas luteoviolacea DSM 6061]MBE0386242.1 hypothetical protein [Pseudoalteromonas luteoviolacea DSM 6061]
MITKNKLSQLIESTLTSYGFSIENAELAAHVERIYPELVKTASYPAWDSKDDTLAYIGTLILQINQHAEFKNELKALLVKEMRQSLAESRPCWFVGASWGKQSVDQTQRFIEQGIWENGYEDKYTQDVKSIKVGDRIAIKSAYTRRKDLPFETRGNTVSVMGIKAVGVVTGNKKDGRQLQVDWQKTYSPAKEWYFYTGRTTVWRVEPGEWITDALIKFTFEDAEQNYKKFANHASWKERFGDIPEDDIRFKWTGFYEAIANELSDYKNNRAALIDWMMTVAQKYDLSYIMGKNLEDIDPFTVMGIFNRNIRPDTRKEIAHELADFLQLDIPVPESFEAIPVLNNQRSWFFSSKEERGEEDINNLWALFDAARGLADENSEDDSVFVNLYNKVAAQHGIRWNLSMGLYWVRPWSFPTLEKQSKAYLATLSIKPQRNGPDRSCSGRDYLSIREDLQIRFAEPEFPVHSFPELSLLASLKPIQKKENTRLTWKTEVLSRVKGLCHEKRSAFFSRVEFKARYLKELEALFPDNNSAEFSIDSNMQKLRDEDEIRFVTGGNYEWLSYEESLEDDEQQEAFKGKEYTVESIVEEGCFLSQDALEDMLYCLKERKNLILQGPPGTGKTWLGKRLGYALIGQEQQDFIKAVQFHPNISYEDFIIGWRPNEDGNLSLCEGPFLEFVRLAQQNAKNNYVVVIEEINRGNPAQIFGEMLTLLEEGKRTPREALELSYRIKGDEPVYIPENLYVIGTMNVADRSLAMVDLALRRRFSFIDLEPTFGKPWRDWVHQETDIDLTSLEAIERRINALNKVIAADESLGEQFKIGHSYVTPARGCKIEDVGRWFKLVVETQIYPVLIEYWFDEPSKAKQQKDALLKPL